MVGAARWQLSNLGPKMIAGDEYDARAGVMLRFAVTTVPGKPHVEVTAAVTATSATAQVEKPMGALRPDQIQYRALYKELVETNTTLSVGSCTQAAQMIAGHL